MKEDKKKDDKKKETGRVAAAETKGKEKDTEEAQFKWLNIHSGGGCTSIIVPNSIIIAFVFLS